MAARRAAGGRYLAVRGGAEDRAAGRTAGDRAGLSAARDAGGDPYPRREGRDVPVCCGAGGVLRRAGDRAARWIADRLGRDRRVLSATCYAVYMALTRKVSATDSTATSMVFVGVGGLVLTSAVGSVLLEADHPAIVAVHRRDHGHLDRCARADDGGAVARAGQHAAAVQLCVAAVGDCAQLHGVRAPDRPDRADRRRHHRWRGLVVMGRERYLIQRGRKTAPVAAEEETPPH